MPRIDYVDGAVEPVLVRGQALVIEGFGFGAVRRTGSVRFAGPGGAEVEAPVPDSAAWSDLAIRTSVPDSAVAGPLAVVAASGLRLSAMVHVLPRVPFDPNSLSWQARSAFPRAPVGVAVAAGEFPAGATLSTTIYAVGGAEQVGGNLVPDSGVYVTHAQASGAIGSWVRQHDTADVTHNRVLPAPRVFTATAVATRYNSRFIGSVLYVIGGIDSSGQAQASVLAADVTADSVASQFVSVEPLPAPVAGAIALVRRGRIYVIGGTDSTGHSQRRVFVGRVGVDGHIDGWYQQPQIPTPRAYGGGVALDGHAIAFGGLSDSVPPGGGLDLATTRLASSDTAALSLISGFFIGPWATGAPLLPASRSQFATLEVGTAVLLVGGMYSGAGSNSAEMIAASLAGDSIGRFRGPVGTNTIAGQGGGTLVGPAGITWRVADGTHHGFVLGGVDLKTGLRKSGVWGF